MSYSDVKIFTETMRMIQYPSVISIQSFQKPNFKLVSDLLRWLIHRFDPEIEIHPSIETENDRVLFITSIVKGFYQRTKMKLNPKRLYAADGHAVKELLKLALFLHQSIFNDIIIDQQSKKTTSTTTSKYLKVSKNKSSLDLINLDDIKSLRKMASEVTEKSSKLHELLQREMKFDKQQKNEAFKFLDSVTSGFDDSSELQQIETTLVRQLQMKKTEASNLERECKELESDRSDLVEEIKKKTIDLERNVKRLESIDKARPAFMDEYELLEEELQKHYDLYMERYRNLHYLRKEMEKYQREDEEKLKRLGNGKKSKDEKLSYLRDGYHKKETSEIQHAEEKLMQVKNNIDNKEQSLHKNDESSIIIDDDEEITNKAIFIEDDDKLSLEDDNSSGFLSQRDNSRDEGQTSTSSKKSSFSIISEGTEDVGNSSSEVGRSNNSIDSDEFF